MSIILQMDLAVARIQIETIRAIILGWDPDVKFKIIASAPWAENLGFCGLVPEKAYPTSKIECVGLTRIIVHLKSDLYILVDRDETYLLPERYANVDSEADIDKINSRRIKFDVIGKGKKCGPDRLSFDYKNYTWDLVLRRRL